jgi:H+/Cl- antiporter ClcA
MILPSAVSDYVDYQSLWKVVVLGAVFAAVGVVAYSIVTVGIGEARGAGERTRGRRVVGRGTLLAAAGLLACGALVALGIWAMLQK